MDSVDRVSATARGTSQCPFKILCETAAFLIWHIVLVLMLFDCMAIVLHMAAWTWFFYTFTRVFVALSGLLGRYLEVTDDSATSSSDKAVTQASCVRGPGLEEERNVEVALTARYDSRHAQTASTTEVNGAPLLPASGEIGPNTLDSAEQFQGSRNESATTWGELSEQNMADHSNSVTCTNESRRRGEGTIVDSEAGRDAGWNLRDTLEPPMQTPVALYGSSESCNADLADARRFHDEVTKKGIKGRGSRSSVKRVPARRQSSSHNRKSFADPQRSTTPTTSNPIKGVNKEASDRIPPHLRARLEAPAQSCASPHRTAHLPWKPKESVAAAYSSDKPSAASSADKSLAAPSSDESLGKSSPTSKNNVSSFADTALNSPSHREDSRESPSSNDGTGIDQSSIGQITDLPATSPTVKPKSAPERVDEASHKGNLPPIATEIKSTVAMAQGTPVSPPHPLQYRVDFTHQVPQHSVVIPPPPNGIQLSDPHRSIQSASHITMNASHAYAAADHLHGLQTISRPSPYRSNPGMQALPSHAIYDQVAPYPAQDQHSVWPSSTPMPSTPDQASWQTSPPGLPYVPSTQSHGFWRSVVPVIPSWTSLGPPTFPAHHEMPSAYTFDHGQKPVGFFVDDSPPSPVPDHLSAPSSGVSSLKMINGYSAFPTALDTVAAGQQLPQSSQHNQTQLLMNGGSKHSSSSKPAGPKLSNSSSKSEASPKRCVTILSASECEAHFKKSGVRFSRAVDNSSNKSGRIGHREQPLPASPEPQQDGYTGQDLINLADDEDEALTRASSTLVLPEQRVINVDYLALVNDEDEELTLSSSPLAVPDPPATNIDLPKTNSSQKSLSNHESDFGDAVNPPTPPGTSTTASESAGKSTKFMRKEARRNLNAAWFARESSRKQLISSSTWPLELWAAFELATREYNAAREALAQLKPLTDKEQRFYPKLSAKTTTAPKVRPPKYEAV